VFQLGKLEKEVKEDKEVQEVKDDTFY